MTPRVVLVMGVAGTGKTTVGEALARELAWEFLDADRFHDSRAIEKMRAGEGLSDRDRAPWLGRIRGAIERRLREGRDVVVACSALKSAYRKTLIGGAKLGADVTVVWLHGAPELLRERLEKRRGHFAGADLLASQLRDLEPPPHALSFDVSMSVEEIVGRIRSACTE